MLDSKKIQNFLKKAVDELHGDWILIGGTVLPALGIDHRVTVDIDLVPLTSFGNDEMLGLMSLAEELGLPVETINSAGGFFLKKIPGYENEILLLREGKTARIFRPQFLLYLKLKLARLSETDLQDVLTLYKYCRKQKETIDHKVCVKWIDEHLKKNLKNSKELTPAKIHRLEVLKNTIKF